MLTRRHDPSRRQFRFPVGSGMDYGSRVSPPGRRSRDRGWRLGAAGVSAGAHTAFILAVLLTWKVAPTVIAPAPIDISLAPALAQIPSGPKASAPPAENVAAAHASPAAAHALTQAPAAPPPLAARSSPAPPAPESLSGASTAGAGAIDGAALSDAELAGAARADAGGGSGGGECDMARRVQAALRKDPLARAAVHASGARAIRVWNGDWVQAGAEEGKGLAAVREAITFEVAFAPPACRQARVRGLVLLTLNDGSPPLALGAGDWRWSDLLGVR
jgi:hypothetical protein